MAGRARVKRRYKCRFCGLVFEGVTLLAEHEHMYHFQQDERVEH